MKVTECERKTDSICNWIQGNALIKLVIISLSIKALKGK